LSAASVAVVSPNDAPFLHASAPPRLGGAVDYFFARRRSTAIGARFWRFVADGWASFDAVERTRCARLFARYRPYWSAETLSPADRVFYNALPDEFLVYRGQNGRELPVGGAFTPSLTLARHAALGRRNVRYADPTVVSLAVSKNEVALAFFAREEEAIVLFPSQAILARAEARALARLTH
jgi:hypothetical protein